MQSILDGLTETELEQLQDLVEYANELSKSLEYVKYTTLYDDSERYKETFLKLLKEESRGLSNSLLGLGQLQSFPTKITGKLS